MDTRDPRSIVEEAEQAAAAGDYASAERLLREAVSLQEASLGPQHSDLANTLNNLAVVCEITDQPDEAERCYRRAVEIAAATLDPDHPFRATSRKNLEDFLASRGTAVEPPPAPEAVEAMPAPVEAVREAPAVAPVDVHRGSSSEAPFVDEEPRLSRTAVATLMIAGLIVLVLGAMVGTRSCGASPESPSPSAPAENPAATSPDQPAVVDPPRPTAVVPPSPQPSPPRNPPAAQAEPARPFVAAARLCQEFEPGGTGDWPCVPVSGPVAPGPLVFYTRLKSPLDTTVEHRWYRGSQLRQTRTLTIHANTETGYRTYSRLTVGGTGDWKVELRSRDGALLHEERFAVR